MQNQRAQSPLPSPPAVAQPQGANNLRRDSRLVSMMFTKRLREGVRRGEITSSVRIWLRPRVRVGGRYRMEEGEIEVDSIQQIGFPDITPELARQSGFLGVLDLLKIAKHGRGENIYLVCFHYIAPHPSKAQRPVKRPKSKASPRVIPASGQVSARKKTSRRGPWNSPSPPA
jgi:hypothetical protein